ncbi:hypothetical protein [Calditerrivibrio nitroreducens]|uniref:hypothetical protein n=1 Tax=Calditerrivibrio nitroreducens TaxID=477976 RepID=UPI003C755C1D
MEIEIYIKGSYIPRDEKMCINVLIKYDKKEVSRYFEISQKGSAIEAEYLGLIKIINTLKTKLTRKNLTILKIYSQNESIMKQLTGEYRVSNSRILNLYSELKSLLGGVNYQAIWLSKSEMSEKLKPHAEMYNEKQLKDILNKIDFDDEDIWI